MDCAKFVKTDWAGTVLFYVSMHTTDGKIASSFTLVFYKTILLHRNTEWFLSGILHKLLQGLRKCWQFPFKSAKKYFPYTFLNPGRGGDVFFNFVKQKMKRYPIHIFFIFLSPGHLGGLQMFKTIFVLQIFFLALVLCIQNLQIAYSLVQIVCTCTVFMIMYNRRSENKTQRVPAID